jgi:glycosyltransferase involved in cell wall biosynthesis
MRIAFFTDTYWPQINGISENIDTVKKGLERLGHEVYIVAPKSSGYKDEDPNIFRLSAIKIIKNPEQKVIIPIPEKDLRKLFRHKFDMVHVHTLGTAGFLGWEVAQLRDLPCVVTYHTLLNRYSHYILKGKLIRPKVAEVGSKVFCNLCDIVVAPTKRVKKELLSYGVTKEISVIPGGIELERFDKLERGFLRKKLGISGDKKIILYLGRLGKEKNIGFIIRSLKNLLKRRADVCLAIVGEGPEKNNLEKLVGELGLKEKVLFVGFIERKNVPRVYSDSDIFVFASNTETQGLTVPEAMAASLPVVVVRDPAFEEIIFEGKTGLISEPTEASFASEVRRLLESEELRERLGASGKELVEKRFSAKVQAKDITKAYKRAIKINSDKKKVSRILKSRVSLIRDFLKINVAFTKFKEAMKALGEYEPY